MPKYALLSVFDKTNIEQFAKGLESLGFTIISTGGTSKILTQNNTKVTPIQEITGNPESFDGRLKTISFEIEGGILYDRTNPDHVKQALDLKIPDIQIVVCNLYPFEKSPSIENIDVGGPTMLRAAAKNYQNVLPLCDPADYDQVLEKLKLGTISLQFRQMLAQKTFEHLSFYDAQVSQYFRFQNSNSADQNPFPKELTIPGRRVSNLRWGDNPHQKAALYLTPGSYSPFLDLKKIHGRDLSGTNITDMSIAFEAVRLFDEPAAVVIKHNTPCGIALGKTAGEALKRAIESDSESAFGGVIVLNKPIDKGCEEIIKLYKDNKKAIFDILAAPGIDKDLEQSIGQIRSTMGVYILGKFQKPQKSDTYFKEVAGGFVRQDSDWDSVSGFKNWKVVTKKKPTPKQMEQMKLSWTMIRRMRSNAVVVFDKDLPMTRGIGTGQTSRYRACKIALELGQGYTQDAILASDAFFPFDDCVREAGKAKIACIVQTGGSIRDEDSIKAADELGMVMVMTGERLFWHY